MTFPNMPLAERTKKEKRERKMIAEANAVYDLDWNIRSDYNVALIMTGYEGPGSEGDGPPGRFSRKGDIGMDDDERLLIFAKFPEKGMVKTRLGRLTGEETAA